MELTITYDDGDETTAEITRCVLNDNLIRILFKGDDGDPFEGRIWLKPINDKQTTTLHWIYPDTVKEKERFSGIQQESEETKFPHHL